MVLFFTHIPFVVNHTINATTPERLQQFYHFVKNRNLPFSGEEAKEVCQRCRTCAEIKPRFCKLAPESLVKATRPWERLSMDFKGPVRRPKPYLLIIIDEYNSYQFVFPSKNTSTTSVIECLSNLFCLFGFPAYTHSDRGSSFMSRELKEF